MVERRQKRAVETNGRNRISPETERAEIQRQIDSINEHIDRLRETARKARERMELGDYQECLTMISELNRKKTEFEKKQQRVK